MRNFRLHFPFAHAGFYKSQCMRANADAVTSQAWRMSPTSCSDLTAPKFVQQRGQPTVIMQWIAAHGIDHEPSFAAFDFDHRALMLVGIQEDVVTLAHQAVEQALEIRKANGYGGCRS